MSLIRSARFELHFVRFTTALRAWYIPIRLGDGTIPFALQISFHSFSANVIDSSSKLVSVPHSFACGIIQLTDITVLLRL